MKLTRGWILTIGPVLLVATCYAVAGPSHRSTSPAIAVIDIGQISDDAQTVEPLDHQCETVANSLRARLNPSWNIIIHEPFVLATDQSVEDLEHHFRETIVPTAAALARGYFNISPRHPITILLCSTDERFRECNLRLDDQQRSQYSGLYIRKHRRVIVNIASGEGTLAHE